MSTTIENVVIIGSGPAGHTAGIYAGRAKLNPLMFEGLMAGGVAAGGQLTTTTDVENFPGFPDGVMGPELMYNMRSQSEKCGTRIETETVDKVDLSETPYKIYVGDRVILAHSIIIATGATAKRLGVPGEETYWQKGISACAVCDGGLPLFRDKPLVVVGGGDTACEEAHYLSKFGSKVTLLVRRGEMRASKAMQERVMKDEKIEILWHTVLDSVGGEDLMSWVRIKDVNRGELRDLEASGLFYAIGHTPNTDFLSGQLPVDDAGYVLTQSGGPCTDMAGVFAAGDVQDHVYRQAVTAAGSGCMAALEAERYLASLGVV